MNKGFEAIVLSNSGDFLLEEDSKLERDDKGVTLHTPYIINEDGLAQRVKAETIFIPYHSLDNIQHGDFEQEVAK